MGWQDREYNSGGEQMGAYLTNPAGLLQFSLPVYRSASFYVRLHFWFLIFAVFVAINDLRSGLPFYYIPLDVGIMLVAAALHELGHMVFARTVGGNHWEWVLWPLGGMVRPSAPPRPWNSFVANAGGLFFSIPLEIAGWFALHLVPGISAAYFWRVDLFDPVIVAPAGATPSLEVLAHVLGFFFQFNAAVCLINFFPAIWFDGGYIWQAVLWPKFGQWRAMRMTCMAGMVLAVPCLLLALVDTDFFGMIIWALVFASCLSQRRALAEAGPGVMDSEETYNYMDTPEPVKKKRKKRWLRSAKKKAVRDQAEQAKIDLILAKVKDRGLHSLSFWEKRALKRATERQRQRDLANRP